MGLVPGDRNVASAANQLTVGSRRYLDMHDGALIFAQLFQNPADCREPGNIGHQQHPRRIGRAARNGLLDYRCRRYRQPWPPSPSWQQRRLRARRYRSASRKDLDSSGGSYRAGLGNAANHPARPHSPLPIKTGRVTGVSGSGRKASRTHSSGCPVEINRLPPWTCRTTRIIDGRQPRDGSHLTKKIVLAIGLVIVFVVM